MNTLITIDSHSYPVLTLPGRPKALLDRTIALLYNVPTKRVNEAVSRNSKKFPADFYFELTPEETKYLAEVAFCDFAWKGGHKPKAFTAFGINMLSTILKSEIATRRCVEIIKSFTTLEETSTREWDRITAKIIASINNKLHDLKLEFDKRMLSLEQRVALIEKNNLLTQNQIEKISARDLQKLKTLAAKKVNSRSELLLLWKNFRTHFNINKYSDLPQGKMGEAFDWVSKF